MYVYIGFGRHDRDSTAIRAAVLPGLQQSGAVQLSGPACTTHR